MKKKYFETQDFKSLQKDWYQILKEDGFEDKESEYERDNYCIETQKIAPKREWIRYNKLCLQYLNSGQITDKLDHFIFENHCEGLSATDISKLLKPAGFRTLTKQAIAYRINKILSEAGIDPVVFSL